MALVVSLLTYLAIKYLVRTPFGITLQGIRDDPIRMASLGYNVVLHRTLAFGFAAFIASLAGVLFVWWNNHVDPNSINLDSVINLLVIAVIGGLYRLEGAWIGAFFFVIINNEINTYNVTVPAIGGSFYTVIGLIFLVIVLVSPGGLLGVWDLIGNFLTREESPIRRSWSGGPVDQRRGGRNVGPPSRIGGPETDATCTSRLDASDCTPGHTSAKQGGDT